MIELECLPIAVGHGDEGVCLLVKMGPHRILLDCGLEDISSLPVSNGESLPADLVVCSHAHPDHAQSLLTLHQAFPELPIYASEVTTHLLPLNWPQLLSTEIPEFCQSLPWRSPVEVCPGLTMELFPAGHLPGASVIILTYSTPGRNYTLVYSGDFFLSNSRLVEGLPLEELRGLEPDVLIVSGTYGTSRHPHRRNQENQLAERIYKTIIDRHSVILPAPTLGLGQELLMLLRSHHHFTGRDLDIWVDGTLASGCDAYLELMPNFPAAVQNFARHQPLFWDERVRPRVRRLEPDQYSLLGQSPCIVIADKTQDISKYCYGDSGPWLVLLPQKPGRSIKNHPAIPDKMPANISSVETYLLAQHCDGPGTTQLIHNLRPQHIIFIHGSPAYLADLTSLEELNNRYHLHCPSKGALVELPIGETFLQPAAPEVSYAGEVKEFETEVQITLSTEILENPRWQNFSDTGLVSARWQGEELVLRGLSQRELLNQGSDTRVPIGIDCCASCRHYRGQRCWNQASSLFGFKVTSEGYCPVFEPTLNSPSADD